MADSTPVNFYALEPSKRALKKKSFSIILPWNSPEEDSRILFDHGHVQLTDEDEIKFLRAYANASKTSPQTVTRDGVKYKVFGNSNVYKISETPPSNTTVVTKTEKVVEKVETIPRSVAEGLNLKALKQLTQTWNVEIPVNADVTPELLVSLLDQTGHLS